MIPAYERQLSTNALPGAAVQAYGDADAYGAGIAGQITKLAGALDAKAAEAEDADVAARYREYQRRVMDYHANPDTGIYNARKLGGARGASVDADKWMGAELEKSAKGLSARARRNFERLAGGFRDSQHLRNMNWEYKQLSEYTAAETEGVIANELDALLGDYRNPEALQAARERIFDASFPLMNGMGAEAREKFEADLDDRIASVVSGALIADDPVGAVAWLDEHKDMFSEAAYRKNREAVEKAVRPYRQEAIRDQILSRYAGDEAGAIRYVRDNFGGDEERQIMGLVESAFADQRRLASQERAEMINNIADGIAGSRGYGEAMAAANRVQEPQLRARMQRYARSLFGNGSGGGPVDDSSFIRMITGSDFSVSSDFGVVRGKRNHGGIDYAVPSGTPIRAPLGTDGLVLRRRHQDGGAGRYVTLSGKDTNGDDVTWYFMHLSDFGDDLPPDGSIITAGQAIAISGGDPNADPTGAGRSSGAHIHAEVRVNGKKTDPRKYLSALAGGADAGGGDDAGMKRMSKKEQAEKIFAAETEYLELRAKAPEMRPDDLEAASQQYMSKYFDILPISRIREMAAYLSPRQQNNRAQIPSEKIGSIGGYNPETEFNKVLKEMCVDAEGNFDPHAYIDASVNIKLRRDAWFNDFIRENKRQPDIKDLQIFYESMLEPIVVGQKVVPDDGFFGWAARSLNLGGYTKEDEKIMPYDTPGELQYSEDAGFWYYTGPDGKKYRYVAGDPGDEDAPLPDVK